MRKAFRDLSIRVKLIILMMLTSGSVLALVAGTFLTLELRSESREVEAELTSLAGVIGFNCRAALVFADRSAAEKTLDALKFRPEVIGAWILTPAEEPFARYERQPAGKLRSASAAPPRPASQATPRDLVAAGGETHWLEDGSLLLRRPVILDDELVGILVLRADLGEIRARVSALSTAVAAVLLFSFLLALLLASWLQRFISRPIVEMTGLMGEVSRAGNYGLRLARRSGDEVGQLVSGFNNMLEQIEERDHRLEEANRLLEQRVAGRTEELSRANVGLGRLLEEYRQTESRFRSLFENSPVPLWEEDYSAVKLYLDNLRRSGIEDFAAYFCSRPDAVRECAQLIRILNVNQATVRLFRAASKHDLLGNLDRVFTAESYAQFREELVALAQGRTRVEVEGVNQTLDGDRRFVKMQLSVVPGHEETWAEVIVSLVDLTERRQAEESLRRLGKALETTRVGITISDLEGRIVFTNSAEASMHGYEIEELLGQKVNLLGPPELRAEFPAANVETGQRESLNLRKDGSIFPVQLVSDLVVDAGGNPLAVVTVCEDITERKETEARLRASIVEKDVLLKEVHHRVKNNLQIISSLLNLQMKKITEAKTRAELNATRNRIRSMALIHAKLYQSKNLSQINFAEYIEEFSRQLRSLYNVSPKKVKLVLDIDAVYLDVDVAIPCGMIVNELLTNALKYAFPEERSGEIRVVLRSELSETVLSVEDNGVGLPPEIDMARVETLGLQLVRGLAQQINGTVTVEQNGGTRVVIRCPAAGSGMQKSV